MWQIDGEKETCGTKGDLVSKRKQSSNGLLRDTCKHIRRIRDSYFSSYHLSGILIDSFVFNAIGGWRWSPPGEEGYSSAAGTYEKSLLDYLNRNMWVSLKAPGSNQVINTADYSVLEKILKYMVR